jgi:hypothetical protein
VFQIDVTKVNQDVAYIAIAIQYVASVCSKCFICFSDICCKCVYLDVAYVSHICYKYFVWTLHMFAVDFQVF